MSSGTEKPSFEGLRESTEASLLYVKALSDYARFEKALSYVERDKNAYRSFKLLDSTSSTTLDATSQCHNSTRGIQAGSGLAALLEKTDSSADWEDQVRLYLFHLNPSTRLIHGNKSYCVFEAPSLNSIMIPPLGYGFKGGAARIALRALLGERVQQYRPRDYDLVRFGKLENETDRVFGSAIMGDDFRHGHGVELIRGIEEYLHSRDLTINEIVLFDKKVYASRTAMIHLIRGILSPSRSHLNLNGNSATSNLLCKMLRLKAQASFEGDTFHLAFTERPSELQPFDIALNLDRALQRSPTVAKRYLRSLIELGYVPLTSRASSDLIHQAITYLNERTPRSMINLKEISRFRTPCPRGKIRLNSGRIRL